MKVSGYLARTLFCSLSFPLYLPIPEYYKKKERKECKENNENLPHKIVFCSRVDIDENLLFKNLESGKR